VDLHLRATRFSMNEAAKPSLPFWISPPSRGIDKGKPYHSWTVAASRQTRKKASVSIRLYDEWMLTKGPEQSMQAWTDKVLRAAQELGLVKDLAGAASIAMLHGWDPNAKPAKLVTATR
jgi:hypothetical protein